MLISELKDKTDIFGKLIAKVEGWDDKITTYGYIRHVNGNHIVFQDSADETLKYRVHSVDSFEPQVFKDKSKK